MGAIPSKESNCLFSFFRGTYEVGLIPLTKHFFGDVEEINEGTTNDNVSHLQETEDSTKWPKYPIPVDERHSMPFVDVINRKQLRSQLLKMRSDPAVLYSNARDTDNMIRTIRAHLQNKKGSKNFSNVNDDQKALHNGTIFQEAEVTSVSGSNASSANNCSREDGLSKSVPKSDNKRKHKNEGNSSISMTSNKSVVSKDELIPPDIDNAALLENYWNVMPEPNFTEADLDNFLELVEKELYQTNEDMLTDPRYAIGAEASASSEEERVNHHSTTTDRDITAIPRKHQPRAFIPTPCALCLTYPSVKERRGCFPLEGRNINIIGYFGCMTKEMQVAFKVTKRNTEINVEKLGSSTGANTVFASDEVSARNSITPEETASVESSAHTQRSEGKIDLNFYTSVLTSAGDRTLERVLILAPVMLRQQFHAVHRRLLINQKLRDRLRALQTTNTGEPTATSQLFESCPYEILGLPTSISLNESITANTPRTPKGLNHKVGEGGFMDPLMFMAFSPLPCGAFTLGTYWTQCYAKGKGHERPAPTDENGPHPIDSEDGSKCLSCPSEKLKASLQLNQQSENLFFRCPSTTGTVYNEVTDPYTGIPITNVEEDAISWSFIRRLDSISLTIELSSNNYPALKSLTENFAFMHTQVDIDPNEMTMTLVNLPELDKYTGSRMSEKAEGTSKKNANHNSKEVSPSKPVTAVHTVKIHLEESTDDRAEKSKVMADLNTRITNTLQTDSVSDSYSTQYEALDVAKDNACDTNRLMSVINGAVKPSSCIVTPDSGVVILLHSRFFRQAALWLGSLFCHPLRFSNGCWTQYKFKNEAMDVRCVLQEKDMIVSNWRNSEKEKARTYLGPNTERLLRHVRLLQEETELTRLLLQKQSSSVRVFTTPDNRKYTLHRGKAGTMLIAARGFDPNRVRTVKQSGNNTATTTLTTIARNSKKDDQKIQELSHPQQKRVENIKDMNRNEPSAYPQQCTTQINSDNLLPDFFPAIKSHKESSPQCSPKLHQLHFSSSGPQIESSKPPPPMYQLPQAPSSSFPIKGDNSTLVHPSAAWVDILPYSYSASQVFLPLPSDSSIGCINPMDLVMSIPLQYGLSQEQPQFLVEEPVGLAGNHMEPQSNYLEIKNSDTNLAFPHTLNSSVELNPFNKKPCGIARNILYMDQMEGATGVVANTYERDNSSIESAFIVPGNEVIMNSHQTWNHQDGMSKNVEDKDLSLLTDPFSMGIWPQGVGTKNPNTVNHSNNLGTIGTANDVSENCNLHFPSNAILNTSAPVPIHFDDSTMSLTKSAFELVLQGSHLNTDVDDSTVGIPLTNSSSQIYIVSPTHLQQFTVENPAQMPHNLSFNAQNPHLTPAYVSDMNRSAKFCPPTVNLCPVSSMPGKVPSYASLGRMPFLTDTSAISHGSTIIGSEGPPFYEVPTEVCNDCNDTCGAASTPFFLFSPNYQCNPDDYRQKDYRFR
ncbi:unnamed protein product [Phytomonas sp. Hart1]|nr:unnamed protein product [Phytomonas sp. Hart1]|eukprot:CCW67186.1 unnamed protein product [Phytomonas sp. isolate Hart1]